MANKWTRLEKAVSGHLEPGEQIDLMGSAKFGKPPLKKNAGALAASVAITAVSAALGGGGVGVFYAQRPFFLVLTDRKLLVVGMDTRTGRPTRTAAAVPRDALTATVLKDGLFFLKVRLDSRPVQATPELPGVPSVRLTFAPIPPSVRKRGRKFVAALAQDASTEAGQAEQVNA